MMTFRLSFFVLLSMCTMVSQAQDVGLIGLQRAANSEIKTGTTQNLRLHAKAFQEVATSFNLSIKYKIDNGSVKTSVDQFLVEKHNVGDSLPLIHCPIEFPNKVDDTVLVTLFIESTNDKDAANDTLKQRFVLKQRVANDIEVSIIEPTPGTKLEVGKPFDLVVELKNVGTNYLEQGNILLSYMSINGVRRTPTFQPFSGSRLAPEDVAYQTSSVILDESLDGSTFEICHAFFWSQLDGGALRTIEGNHADNTGCAEYSGIPNSVDEHVNAKLESIYYSSNHLTLSFHEPVQQSLEIQVLSVSGKVMAREMVNGSTTTLTLDIAGAQPGIYFLRMVTRDQRTVTRKFPIH